MTLALIQYIRFKTKAGSYTGTAYQNFFINETKVYNSTPYSYAPFALALNAGTQGGDRSENTLVAPINAISVNVFAEASLNSYLVEVKTVSLDSTDLSDIALIGDDLWRASRLESDDQFASLQLMSPLDAVRGQVPRRFLSSYLVGALPTSSTITAG